MNVEAPSNSYEKITVKVGDFGIAGFKRAGVKGEDTNAGTVKFMAPELHKGEDMEANPALDIWSIGVLLFMMIYGFHPFKVNKDRTQTVKNIIEKPIPFDDEVDVTEE